MKRVYPLVVLILMALALWLPRGLALDRFVTIDENRWLTRSANFHRALVHGEWVHTYQHGHPGVTIMWLGTAGFLWRYPDYAADAPGEFGWENSEFEHYLRTQAHDALDLLAAGRTFAVLATVLALTLAFWQARRLLGWPVALLGFLLIAFDPFEVALTRFLHLDGLLSSWMILALLTYLCFLYRGRRWGDLVGAAVAAGLAWLTKTPGFFLLPFVGVMALIELGIYLRQPGVKRAWPLFWQRAVAPAVLWALLATLVYVLLWPAMWVDPLGTLQKVLSVSGEYATEGHSNPLFFRGEIINGDPGFWFYPITWLWRSTPVVLLGLLLALLGLKSPPEPAAAWQRIGDRTILLNLLLMGLLFTLFMDLGAKKLDRYLVPIYPALAIAAAYGWIIAWRWVSQWRPHWRAGLPGLAAGVVALQAALLLPTYPYYMSYYNPLLGGSAGAAQQLTLGWGEGLDQAARYLIETQNELETRVSAWYRTGPFDYFYPGTVVSPQYFWFGDYTVSYINQWQRQMPARQIIAYLDELTPEKRFAINGAEYARVYNLREAPLPRFTTDWGGVIRLISYTMPSGDLNRGQQFDIVLQLVNLGPIEKNLNLLLRVVNADGYEMVRYEWRPAGIATVDWKRDELWQHRTTVAVKADTPAGLYRVEVAFFDPDTLERLPAIQTRSGAAIGDTLLLDYLVVEGNADQPAQPLDPPVDLDNKVALLGSTITFADGTELAARPVHAGDELRVRTFWQTTGLMTVNYTAFGQLISAAGEVKGQHDGQLLAGFVPTSLWYPGQRFVDQYTLTVPADIPPGSYTFHIGLYDLATLNRLPMHRAGTPSGDNLSLATITVE